PRNCRIPSHRVSAIWSTPTWRKKVRRCSPCRSSSSLAFRLCRLPIRRRRRSCLCSVKPRPGRRIQKPAVQRQSSPGDHKSGARPEAKGTLWWDKREKDGGRGASVLLLFIPGRAACEKPLRGPVAASHFFGPTLLDGGREPPPFSFLFLVARPAKNRYAARWPLRTFSGRRSWTGAGSLRPSPFYSWSRGLRKTAMRPGGRFALFRADALGRGPGASALLLFIPGRAACEKPLCGPVAASHFFGP